MSGLDGVSFSEIQRYICGLNGLDFDEMVIQPAWNSKTKTTENRPRRRWRGYWCTNLCGLSSPDQHREGILEKYCIRIENGNYISK
jgi:hypothetical protein